VGTLSLLLASALALVERDIKKLWAYSTISQLGYMIMAVGAGGTFAGFFHLTTHAGFKALLFLCAGVWIHYLETNDLYELSRRQARKLKLPLVGFLLAGASLSGIPPLSGFFSKEAVLGALAELDNPCWLLAGMAGVFLTAYYAFRPVFIILFPRETEPGGPRKDPAGDPAYRVMAGPLAALIAWILILGFLETPLRDFLAGQSRAEGPGPWIPGVSQVLVFSALILAWVEFGRKGSRQIGFAERLAPLRKLLAEGWYLDRFYRVLLEQVLYRIFADLLTRNERQLLDRGLERLGHFTRNGGGRLARLQSGRLRYNLLGTFAVLVLAALYFFI
jgi:NADH-quinone oxidoreductase subunit L